MSCLRAFTVVVLLLAAAPSAWAWGPDGHRIVAELAERRLSEHARAAVAVLLCEEAGAGLAAIANWPDEVRREKAWRHTMPWHFVNLPDLSCDYDPVRDCPDGECIVAAIERQTAVLADATAAHEKRVAALKFVVHLVGDVHQPLHAGLKSDRGGNDYQVNVGGEGSNLHRIWDSTILAGQAQDWREYADRLEREPYAIAVGSAAGGTPLDWALESCRAIGAHGLYPPDRDHLIDEAYLERLRPLAEQRLRLAATRLARVLERALALDTAGY